MGLDFADKVIDPAFNDFVKEVGPTYPIGEILPKREEIRQRAMRKLGDNLSRYHIIVEDIYFANIRFSPEYEKAIEAKQVAQQQVETQRQVLAQREIEAQQKGATSKGEAEAILVVAQGQAKANDALSRSISPILVEYELFVVPGTFVAGITGGILMLVALVMGMVDIYPGSPTVPSFPDLQLPLSDVGIALAGSAVIALVLARYPTTPLFRQLVSESASGVESVASLEATQNARLGRVGVTVTNLCPGGKARFEEDLLDVVTRGEMVEKGHRIRIIGYSASAALVEAVEPQPESPR